MIHGHLIFIGPGACTIKLFSAVIYGFQVLHSRAGSWPHPQTFDKAGEACKGQVYYENL